MQIIRDCGVKHNTTKSHSPWKIGLGLKFGILKNKIDQLRESGMHHYACETLVRNVFVNFYLAHHIPVSFYKDRLTTIPQRVIPQTLASGYITNLPNLYHPPPPLKKIKIYCIYDTGNHDHPLLTNVVV